MIPFSPGAAIRAAGPAVTAVLPGTTHMTITRRPDLIIPMLTAFLD